MAPTEDRVQRITDNPSTRSAVLQVLKHRSRRGMNLVEVMIVVAIIVILIAILSVGSLYAWQQFQVSQSRLKMDQVATAINSQLFMGSGKLPQNLDELGMPEDSLLDAWGNKFIYEPSGKTFNIRSLGSDGSEGGTGTAADLSYNDS